MRTTLSLDDDVYRKVKSEVRRTGRPFKEVVNELLRRSLCQKEPAPTPKFRIEAREMELREGVDISNIHQLLDDLDGAARR